MDLNSTFKAQNNALEIITDFNLSKLAYENTQEQELSLDLAKNALDLFCDTKGNLHLEFKMNTQLDKPALSPEQIKKMILKAAMKNLANQSPQEIVNKVSSAIDKYKNIGKELKNIFGNN